MLESKLRKIFNRHFEWIALAMGLLIMGVMNPYIDNGSSWCMFDWLGVTFCPGEGLGNSVAFIFRGDFTNAIQANVMGFFAVIVLTARIMFLLKAKFINNRANYNE